MVAPTYPVLKVIKATYGLNKDHDCTLILQKMSEGQGGGLSILRKVEFNWSLGDPEPGAHKILKLDYRYGEDGEVFHEEHPENGHGDIVLPKEDRPWDKLWGVMTLRIFQARGLPSFSSKSAVVVRWECAKTQSSPKTPIAEPNAKQPQWPDNTSLVLKFAGEVDAKFNCKLTVLDNGFFTDTVIARAEVPLSTFTGNREQHWIHMQAPSDPLHPPPLAGAPPIELLVQASWSGRGGPRKLPKANVHASQVPPAAPAKGAS